MHQISPTAIPDFKIFPGENHRTPAFRGRGPLHGRGKGKAGEGKGREGMGKGEGKGLHPLDRRPGSAPDWSTPANTQYC